MLRGLQQMDCVSFFIWVRRVKIRTTFTYCQIALEKSSNIIEAFEQREFRFRPPEIWVSELTFSFFTIKKLLAFLSAVLLPRFHPAHFHLFSGAAGTSSGGAHGGHDLPGTNRGPVRAAAPGQLHGREGDGERDAPGQLGETETERNP